MSQSNKPSNIGRNIAIRTMLGKAIEIMEMIGDPLELWCITDLAPEVRDSFEPNVEKMMSIELGPLTRNTRVELDIDHLMVQLESGKSKVKLPYDAIYCMATTGDLAKDLSWIRVKDQDIDIAHVNLVEGFHGIPKYAK